GKAFLAQTIGCARCHDHKFDPIPTRDYYALAGILRNVKTLEHANVSQWIERPLPAEPDQEAVLQRHEKALATLEASIQNERKRLAGPTLSAGAVAVTALPGIVVDDANAKRVGAWQPSRAVPSFIGQGYLHDQNTDKGQKSLTFQPELPEAGAYEVRLAYTAAKNRSRSVPVTVFSADGEKVVTVDMQAEPPIEGRFCSLGQHHFERNNQGYVLISNEGTDGYVSADAVVFIPASQVTALPGGARATGGETLRRLEGELKRLRDQGPKREKVASVLEEPAIGDTRIHIRGSVHTLGATVPRGFLQVATASKTPQMASAESGRRELAAWLAAVDNPLTARVFANRAWHWLFGDGLVRTTDNFGTTGEAPSHPELLDNLAVRFMEEGWSVKALVRQIVLSRTYQQSTDEDPKAVSVDPENRFCWRMNRRRLDAECIRDTILAVSGLLRQEMGGPTFPSELTSDYGFKPADVRRSVYAPVFRNALPELFEVLDFADPSLVIGRRNVSTVALQSLFLLNHPFVIDQARQAARRLLAENRPDDETRLVRIYRLALGRAPTDGERRIGLAFVSSRAGTDSEETWSLLVQALFASIDFRYCP
ncbi:MAG: DUF1553 domain-containing protein, partial [Isosphaeraceae bacterium]|nr:DUF1553 domain-containing protein [Isosphaeraceae bacterium]